MPNSSVQVLGKRLFSAGDQDLFARLAGDFNPIHMDPLAARRSLAGGVVVHGVHVLLWSLDTFARAVTCVVVVNSLNVIFPEPLFLGEEIELLLQRSNADEFELMAVTGKRKVAIIRLGLRSDSATTLRPSEPLCDSAPLLPVGEPALQSFEDLAGMTGTVGFVAHAAEFVAAFPSAAKLIGAERLRETAACSRLVGMVCPGLQSVFAELSLEWSTWDASSHLRYVVEETDPRFSLVRMRVESEATSGNITAFCPPAPPRQPAIAELAELVRNDEFKHQTALVIGGSRGLGELTAKAIAAGGGRLLITYVVGKDEAAAVAEEIRGFGGYAQIFPYDVTQSAPRQFAWLAENTPSHVYYFATFRISQARSAAFSPSLLERFLMFYVNGFYDLCRGLRESGVNRAVLFWPSSVFVTDRPKELTEYAMAKAAGEILCANIPNIFRGFRVHQSRLPRLLTDQTNMVGPQNLPRAVDVMLPIIRAMK